MSDNNMDSRVDLNKNSEADIQRETAERVYSQPQQNNNQNIDLNKSNIDLNKQPQQQQGNYTSFGNQPFGYGFNPNNFNQNMSGMYGGPIGNNNRASVHGSPKLNFENYTMFLVFSIIEFICCSWITGVIALIFTILANQKYQQNDMAGFESNYKVAKIVLWIGLAISALITVFFVLYFIIMIALV